MVAKATKIILVGIAAAAVYSSTVSPKVPAPATGSEELPPEESSDPESQSLPLWQNLLISAAASLGFDALGAAARRALFPKAPGAKAAEKVGSAAAEVAEKAGTSAAKEVAEKAGTSVAKEVAEKAAVTSAADAVKVAEKGVVAAEKAGTSAAKEVAEKAAVTSAADAVKVADKGAVITTDAAKAVEKTAASAADAAKAAKAAEKAAIQAVDDATKAGVKSVQLAENAAKATKVAAKASRAAVAASKVSAMLAKAGSMGALGILDLIVSVIVITLQFTVKNFDYEAYDPIPPGYIGYSQLPEEAKIVISQIPLLGSLLDLAAPLFQFGEQCPEGMYQESPGGLCFPRCPEGYKADGAFMCYKQYPEFENNGVLHTLTSVTKNIKLDTGTIPGTCPSGFDNDAGICYPSCRPGFRGIGLLCWADTIGVGVGTPVEPEPCPAGFNADSLLTCSEPVVSSTNPCPEGTWDVAGTCWGKKNLYIDRLEGGGNCRTWCDTNWDSSDGGLCHTRCDPIRKVTDIRQVDEIRVELKDRGLRTSGGRSVGRLNNGGVCPDGKDRIDGLCYNKCPDGYEHVPGAPYNCRKIGEPASYDRGGSSLPSCGDKENISGLCYGNVPSGYTRKALGTLDQNCPAGTSDFGVGCVRESTSRSGTLKLVVELRQLSPEEFTT